MNNFAEIRKYTKTHEWARFIDEKTAYIGITDYAQESLGDLVFVNLPEINETVTAGASFGDAESVKAVSEINSPVTGIVTEVNGELSDSPEKMNTAPYDAWLIKVSEITETAALLDEDQYMEFIQSEKENHS